jgi:hypothetical protein
VFARGKTPTLVETPRWAYLDDDNRPVAWYGGDASDYTINFRNGIKLFLPGFHLDSGGQLFCYGGNYYDYAAGKARELPIQISAVGNPKTAVAKSELKGLIGNIFTTDKKVFLILLFQDHVICEEFTREQNALERSRQFEIRPPTKAAVEYVVVEDYDPTSGSFLVKVGRHLPLLGGPLWFVYDPDTGDFRKVGVFEGYAGFLDRDIFDKALDQASTLPLRPRNAGGASTSQDIGGHTTYFSFSDFRPGFFGSESRPVAALTCSTKFRSPSGRAVDSRRRSIRPASCSAGTARCSPHVQTRPPIRSGSQPPSATAPGRPVTCSTPLDHALGQTVRR